jgi:hypothetical protein
MKTRTRSTLAVLSFALFIILLTGCKKDKDDNNNNSNRNVKYEITGTFSGKFVVVISDNNSGTQTYDNVSLPWSKEVTYGSNVISVGIGAASTTYGTANQTAVMKIYSGGTVVKTSNATAGSSGILSLPTIGHNF